MAKQYVELYAGLCSFDNLVSAFQKAAKGKRANPEVAGFEFNLESNLWTLHRELIGLRYQPGAYRSFYIRDPKLRLISAAPFRDRVVHHALCSITEPLFDRSFIGDSYANRVGKGSHAALDRAQAFARRYEFVLQCDLTGGLAVLRATGINPRSGTTTGVFVCSCPWQILGPELCSGLTDC
jgi:hypothetical protein